jgi:hypothetical protein
MNIRISARVADLERRFRPKGRHFAILFKDGEPSASSKAEQIAAFRAEHGVTSNDQLHEVILRFA